MVAGLFLFPLVETNQDGPLSFANFFKLKEKEEEIIIRPLPNSAPIEETLNFLFFGDLMLDRHVGTRLQGKNLDLLLGGLASSTEFFKFDLVGANLEGAVTDLGKHYAPEMGFDFAFMPEKVEELKKYNFSYFTIANNHISDQGEIGLKETRNNLNNLEFYYSGDSDAQISENSVSFVTIKGRRVALVALSMVYNNFDLMAVEKLVSDARSKADWLIVNIHWGNEYQHNYSVAQQKIARKLIDSGADIIIGHHPHVVQGMEIYKNRPIFYSLGNFIFDQYFSLDTQEGLGLELELMSNKIIITLKPLSSQRSVVNLMDESKKIKFLEKFSLWSQADEGLKRQVMEQIINIAK